MIHIKARALLRFTILVLTALAVTALTVTGCQPQKQAGPPEKITIAYTTLINTVLVHIAIAILINSTFIGRTAMIRVTALHEGFEIIGGEREAIL
ncbi:MAG: hypothetical protein ABSC54_00190 [Smithellaceae bacterium]|jgi:hypothetical protein